ncbi:TPA: hypothetical protein TVN69_000386 [Streptococcus equi subsp. zooepidemicus]|nr:hypothetical protein [Streptococcus equi subsp. zooepidemicus]HEL1229244.1 hypothetical protein [Streptococcus equi subsp. zooepidemicus]
MKNYLGLLGVPLMCATLLAAARPVHAIVDYDPSKAQNDNVIGSRKEEPSGPFIAISVEGKDVKTGQRLTIGFIDYQFFNRQLTKADLMRQIEDKINERSRIYGDYKVVGFAEDASIKNSGLVYGSAELATREHFELTGQKYSLTGTVLVEKVERSYEQSPSAVDFFYTASFYTYNEDGQQQYLLNHYSYNDYPISVRVGTSIEDKTLLNYAYYVLYTSRSMYANLADYVIVKRDQTVVTENSDTPTARTYEVLGDLNKPFAIRFNERPLEYTYNSRKEAVLNNKDVIHEVYEVVKKSDYHHWRLRNSHDHASKTKGVVLNPNISYLGLSDEERDRIIAEDSKSVFEGPIIEITEEITYWDSDDSPGHLHPKTGLPYAKSRGLAVHPKSGLPYLGYGYYFK